MYYFLKTISAWKQSVWKFLAGLSLWRCLHYKMSALLPPDKKCLGTASVRCATHRPFWPVQPALESPHLLPMVPQGPLSLPEWHHSCFRLHHDGVGLCTFLVTTLTPRLTLWLGLDLACTHGLVITGLCLTLSPNTAEATPENTKQVGNHYLWERRRIFM